MAAAVRELYAAGVGGAGPVDSPRVDLRLVNDGALRSVISVNVDATDVPPAGVTVPLWGLPPARRSPWVADLALTQMEADTS